MRTFDENVSEQLTRLGRAFRQWRLARNDTQALAAERLGVSVSTVRRMEAGSSTIPVGVWAQAFEIYGGGLERLERFLEPARDRFETARVIHRKRARRRR